MQNYNCTNKNSISFGWHYRMHTDIVKNVVKKSNLSESVENILLDSVQKPDLDEFFMYGQNHFYYPDDKVKSYLDYTGKHNAKSLYKTHVKNALKALRAGDSENSADEAGRALHYLQDITQPNHIESGSILTKAKNAINPHHRYEMDAYDKENIFYDEYTPVEISANSFNDLFNKTIDISQKNQVPRKDNTESWDDITQNAINLAISSTREFLEMFSSFGL